MATRTLSWFPMLRPMLCLDSEVTLYHHSWYEKERLFSLPLFRKLNGGILR